MRILQVFDFLSLPHGGGTVDVVYRLSRALAARGHEVTICTGDFELDQDYIDSLTDVKVKVFHSWLNWSGIYIMPSLRRLNITDFDVVHCHCYRSCQNVVVCNKARKYGIPYIIDAHGSSIRTSGVKWLLKWFYDVAFGNAIIKNASRVIAETEFEVDNHRRVGVNPSKIGLIHPLFDTEEFADLPPRGAFREKYNIKGKRIIMFLGRIYRTKGLGFLISSFYEVTQKRQDVVLVVVGSDDGYKSTADKLIRDLNLSSKVVFTGFLGGVDKLSALADADVLVQSSAYDPGARPSVEAVLCNIPIIVSKGTGASEKIADIDAGYLVEYGNIGELSDTIQYVLDNPEEAQDKTQKAKEYIKNNLSLDKQIGKYEQLYREAIS